MIQFALVVRLNLRQLEVFCEVFFAWMLQKVWIEDEEPTKPLTASKAEAQFSIFFPTCTVSLDFPKLLWGEERKRYWRNTTSATRVRQSIRQEGQEFNGQDTTDGAHLRKGLQQRFPQLLWIWDWMKVKYELKKDKKDKKEAFYQVSFDASPLDCRLVIHVSRHWPWFCAW